MFRGTRIELVAFLVLGWLAFPGAGDWIDPDTPEDAYVTQPFTPVVPPPYHETKKKQNSKTKHRGPTPSPTESPTETPYPSNSPTIPPTSYPTATPGTYHLVFSDEFNVPERSFEDGVDPRWTSLEKNDYTNDALHYYSTANARTTDEGNLVIKTEAVDTDIIGFDDVKQEKTRVTKHFKSAMVQSWNKFCFTGGIIEAEVTMPGKHNVGGLWPAFWLLGNLARHTYVGSSEHVWPWSSTVCTAKSFDSQLFSGCDSVAHYGMEARLGRGSPEIDIFEVQPGDITANHGVFLESPVGQPFASASFQVAPGRASNRPGNGIWPGPGQWYEGLVGGNKSALNINFYGSYNHFAGDLHPERSDYWSDAISYNRQLDASHFNQSHVFRLEWDVPTDEKDGHLHWFLNGELILAINGTGLKNSGLGSEISSEPSYIIMNTAISSQWGFPKECPPNCNCKKYDCNSNDWQLRCGFSDGFCQMLKDVPQYKVNWVRVYQDPEKEEQKVGCSTPERPTRRYIEAHPHLYKTAQDERPLKPIQVGRGQCDPKAEGEGRASCGGAGRGTCTSGNVCQCLKGWVGPHCLAQEGYDDIVWDEPDSIMDVGFEPPNLVSFRGLLYVFGMLAIVLLIAVVSRGHRQAGYTLVPNADVAKSRV